MSEESGAQCLVCFANLSSKQLLFGVNPCWQSQMKKIGAVLYKIENRNQNKLFNLLCICVFTGLSTLDGISSSFLRSFFRWGVIFLFGLYGPFKDIPLISSRSSSKVDENRRTRGKPPDHPLTELGFPICDPSKARTTAVRNLMD